MKIFFLIIFLLIFIILGMFVYSKYLFRVQIFEDMIFITKYIKNGISFLKDDLDVLLNKCYGNLHYITKKILKENKFTGVLSNIDSDLIVNYFSFIGCGDVIYELNNLSYYENLFNEKLIYHKENKKNGNLYFKLIIGLGVLLIIILMWWGTNLDIEIIFKIAAIGILTAVINQILKLAGKDEITTFVTLAGIIIVLFSIVDMISDLFNTVKALFSIY